MYRRIQKEDESLDTVRSLVTVRNQQLVKAVVNFLRWNDVSHNIWLKIAMFSQF